MNTPFTRIRSAAILGIVLSVTALGAQTVITAPDNKYTPAQDVELGRKAAGEVEQQLPMLRDEDVTSFVASIGRRIVDAIPQEFRHAEFHYSFQVVNVREINAFALPGGPMYVNRGMIEAARTEGEVAGVMAHELSHVALRHGTAQATKATKYEIGTLLGAVVGSIIGGNVGSAVAQGTQFGLGTAFLRFSREFERDADLLGSHIMAGAGYGPLEMASMFKTIEKQGGSGGPQWLSDHPNPGDRYAGTSPAKRSRSRCATSCAIRARSHRRRRGCAGWRRRRRPKRRPARRWARAGPLPSLTAWRSLR